MLTCILSVNIHSCRFIDNTNSFPGRTSNISIIYKRKVIKFNIINRVSAPYLVGTFIWKKSRSSS